MADLYNLLDGLDENNAVENRENENIEEGEEWGKADEVDIQPKDSTTVPTPSIEKPLDLGDFHAETLQDLPYTKLKTWWKQEKLCPELLPFDSEVIDPLLEQLSDDGTDQQSNAGSAINANLQALITSIKHVDKERVQFVVADLLRIRLEKIEQHALYLREHMELLSEAEAEYLQGYGMLLEKHLRMTVLDHIDSAFAKLDEEQMIDTPNTDRYVFARVLEETIVQEGPFGPGACLIAPYKVLQKQTKQGIVELL